MAHRVAGATAAPGGETLTVLVGGATGTIGRQVVTQLLDAGAHVRALTRNPDTASLPSTVEVVRGDLTAPDFDVDEVDAVFLVWTAPPATAPDVIRRIAPRTKRIVYLTAPHKTQHPFFRQPNRVADQHAAIERLIESCGVPYTFLRPGMFAANCIGWWSGQLAKGDVVRWPYGDAPTAPIDERDVAAVAVHALLGEAAPDYVVTGPESLTQREQLSILGEALGRELTFHEITPDEALQELGFPPPAMRMLLNAWAAAVGLPAYVTNTVEDVTGRPARTFRQWAAHNASAF